MIDVSDIEKKIDHAIAAPIPIKAELGGLALENMGQVMEFAKLMSVSGVAVPAWLRSNPGGCLAICSRALRWGMDPFAVAEQSYMARGKGGEEHVGFQAQLIHAVVTSRAPLKGRLRSEIIGEGDERRCRVWGTFKGEDKPHEYTSETLGNKIKALGRNDKNQIKGSPLWDSDPAVQMTYSAVRQWCRLHSSETLLGVYTVDEIEDSQPMDVTPGAALAQRLKDAKRLHSERGFDVEHVAKVIEGDATEATDEVDAGSKRTEHEDGSDRRQMGAEDRPDHDRDQKRREHGREEHQGVRKDAAGQPAARKETQATSGPQKPDRATPRAKKGGR
jgi:RecT family